MVIKIKAWQIFLISVITVSIIGGVVGGATGVGVAGGIGSFTAEAIIWSSIGLGIHYLVRNAGNKEISIYGIVSVPLVFGMWYVAFSFEFGNYYTYATGLTIAIAVNGIYHSINRMRKKEGKA